MHKTLAMAAMALLSAAPAEARVTSPFGLNSVEQVDSPDTTSTELPGIRRQALTSTRTPVLVETHETPLVIELVSNGQHLSEGVVCESHLQVRQIAQGLGAASSANGEPRAVALATAVSHQVEMEVCERFVNRDYEVVGQGSLRSGRATLRYYVAIRRDAPTVRTVSFVRWGSPEGHVFLVY